jgi:hypothetical protein
MEKQQAQKNIGVTLLQVFSILSTLNPSHAAGARRVLPQREAALKRGVSPHLPNHQLIRIELQFGKGFQGGGYQSS